MGLFGYSLVPALPRSQSGLSGIDKAWMGSPDRFGFRFQNGSFTGFDKVSHRLYGPTWFSKSLNSLLERMVPFRFFRY